MGAIAERKECESASFFETRSRATGDWEGTGESDTSVRKVARDVSDSRAQWRKSGDASGTIEKSSSPGERHAPEVPGCFGNVAVGESRAYRTMMRQLMLVAPSESTVLIEGESGTGKELIAEHLHRLSRRASQPLIRVNCASIPKELYESEFFGHVRGAFTGAIKDRVGRFEAAHGGTLFLDEIGEVPLELQSKLLRALQEKRYERVGDERTRRTDARIVAATNRNLSREVAAGRFRQDLFYRLSVFPIQAVPLRERREDIPILAQHFVDLLPAQLKCRKPRLTPAGLKVLQSYDWPGNIRELRNVIERATIMAGGGALEFDLDFQFSSPEAPANVASDPASEAGFLTELEMRQYERANLSRVLQKAGWRIKGRDGAAELLGVKPNTLLARMKSMGLIRPLSVIAGP